VIAEKWSRPVEEVEEMSLDRIAEYVAAIEMECADQKAALEEARRNAERGR